MRKSKTVLRGWPGAAMMWQEVDLRLLTPAQRIAPGAFSEEKTPPTLKAELGKKRLCGI